MFSIHCMSTISLYKLCLWSHLGSFWRNKVRWCVRKNFKKYDCRYLFVWVILFLSKTVFTFEIKMFLFQAISDFLWNKTCMICYFTIKHFIRSYNIQRNSSMHGTLKWCIDPKINFCSEKSNQIARKYRTQSKSSSKMFVLFNWPVLL